MKKQNLVYSIILLAALVFSSCSKDPAASTTTSTSGTGITPPGGNPTNPSTCNFAPYRLGSKIEQVVSGSTYNLEVIKDTMISGEKYFEFKNITMGLAGMYLRVDGSGNVWQFIPPATVSGFSVLSSNMIWLKPNNNVGSTWSYTSSNAMSGFSYDTKYTFKIAEKNITKTINNVTYKNCIRVTLTTEMIMQGITAQSISLDYMWVCGFGYYNVTQNGTEMGKITKLIY